MRYRILIGFAGLVWAGTSGAVASGAADDQVLARQAAMKAMEAAMSDLRRVAAMPAEARRPRMTADIASLIARSDAAWADFGPDTAHTGRRSSAARKIWSNPDGFRAAQTNFSQAVGRLSESADAGSPEVVGERLHEVATACSGCHRNFRSLFGF